MPQIKLTADNYFSPEMNAAFMSCSQFKSFLACESAALAELRGEYAPPVTQALLTGSYVDAHFEGTLDLFKARHPELFKRDGNLKAEYLSAEEAILRAERDELFMLLMSGEKQVIRTGKINGVPFKIKIDSLLSAETCKEIVRRFPKTADVFGFCEGAIVDLKYMRDLDAVWADGRGKIPFVEAWGYDLQGAVYQRIEGHFLPFILAVITKESPPRIAALSVDQPDLDAKLIEVEELAQRYQAIKEGILEPESCGSCAYCRQTETLVDILNYRILGAEERDDE